MSGRVNHATLARRRAHAGGAAVILALALLLAAAAALAPAATAAPTRPAAEKRYGPDFASVQRAIDTSGWPQQDHIWCGLAAMDAVINWRKPTVSQHALASWLNTSPAQSAWGTPSKNPAIAWGPAFTADISRDVGTDPRSIAAGQSQLTGGSYHAVVDRAGPQDATLHLIADLVRTQQPIHAIVFNGGHSVIISGVRATADPVAHPESVTALEVWDPGFGIQNGNIQAAQMTLVPLNDWYTNRYYWSAPYNEDYHGAIAQDPDPSIGPYTYDPTNGLTNHLWVGNYVYFRPDLPGDAAANISVDWEFNQAGALIAGAHGEYPKEWTGAVVALDSDRVIRAGGSTAQSSTTPDGTSTASTSTDQPLLACTTSWCGWLDAKHWWLLGGPLLAIAVLVLLLAMRADARTARAGSHAAKRAAARDTRKAAQRAARRAEWERLLRRKQPEPHVSHIWDDVPDDSYPSGPILPPAAPGQRPVRRDSYTTARLPTYRDDDQRR